MTENTLKLEILKQLEKLNDDEQRRVLQLIQSMQERPHRGTPGKELLSFAGSISKSDLSEMEQAIEQDCEKVNTDELGGFSASGIGGTATIGYRYQPVNGGFTFRAGYTPFFSPGGFVSWGGLSLGYAF